MDIMDILGYHNISYLINASIYLVKGGRLGLMPGVLFHSCHPSFRHTGVMFLDLRSVGTPILSHIDPACNTSYRFAASRTVLPRVPPYLARDRLRLLAHVYDSVASIHMTENPGRHG